MWSAVWAIIGSRVLWFINVLTDPTTQSNVSMLDLFKIWQGGLVAYGGMIGGFLASWYGCHKRKIPLLKWADVSAPSVVLGTGITRIGCFLFGCDYGKVSTLPWAVRFPGPNPLAPHGSPAWQHHLEIDALARTATQSLPVHPTQLYESLSSILLFGLMMLIRRRRKFSGTGFPGMGPRLRDRAPHHRGVPGRPGPRHLPAAVHQPLVLDVAVHRRDLGHPRARRSSSPSCAATGAIRTACASG